MTGPGNATRKSGSTKIDDLYQYTQTPSYINVRCAISRKCRFAMWYKYEKNKSEETINIKWFRTINNNHDLKHHKESGVY